MAPPVTSGLRLQLETDNVSEGNGVAVTTWADQSGNGYDAVGSSTARPTAVTSCFPSGAKGLRFDGSNDILTVTLPTDIATNLWSTARTVFAVFKPVTMATSSGLLDAVWSTFDSYSKLGLDSDGNAEAQASPNGLVVLSGIANGSSYVVHDRYTGSATLAASIGSAAETTDSLGGTVWGNEFNTFYVGASHYQAGSVFTQVDVGAVLVYNRRLSDTELADVVAYLTDKYINIPPSAPDAQVAAVTVTAPSAMPSVGASAEQILITAAALDATVTSENGETVGQTAEATGAANDASVSITVNAEDAQVLGLALAAQAGVAVYADAQTATAAGAANSATVQIGVGAEAAEVTAAANDAGVASDTAPPLDPVIATFSGARLLDLDGVSVRQEGVRFDLLDKLNRKIGEVHPQISVDVARGSGEIKRTLQRFIIPPDEIDEIDLLTNRVQPWWVLETGDEYSLGVFLFSSSERSKFSFGDVTSTSLSDQGFILSQKLQQSIGFGAADAVSTAIQQVLDLAGITSYVVASTSSVVQAPVAWAAGRDSYGKVLSDLCKMGGLLDWYFDNVGVLQIRSVPDTSIDAAELLLAYGEGDRIIAGTLTENTDPLTAPNRYLIIDTSSPTNSVVGVYDVPDTAPHSFANRGFYITSSIEIPGVGDIPQALVAAEAVALQDRKAYDTVTFQSSADPRHDTYDLINYRGSVWIELAWSLRCAPGGPMRHTMKKVYA